MLVASTAFETFGRICSLNLKIVWIHVSHCEIAIHCYTPFSLLPTFLLGLIDYVWLHSFSTDGFDITIAIVVDDARNLGAAIHLLMCGESMHSDALDTIRLRMCV